MIIYLLFVFGDIEGEHRHVSYRVKEYATEAECERVRAKMKPAWERYGKENNQMIIGLCVDRKTADAEGLGL